MNGFKRGGESFASYENVVTTAKVISTSNRFTMNGGLAFNIETGSQTETQLCQGTGGGVQGPIVLFCKVSAYIFKHTLNFIFAYSDVRTNLKQDTSESENTLEFPMELGMNTDFYNKEEEESTAFSTTWSYTTSATPAR